MSISVNVYYSGKDGSAGKFAEEMESLGIAEQIRRKQGNLKYAYFLPMNDPETVLLIDCWQSQSDLDEHHSSPVMEKILDLREKYDLHMKVERYSSDNAGIPDSDHQFIRK
ncbi:MAG TPA: antibiotic biosynthesis monooxygenase [Anaerolineaceae bacterium]|nr:antibiotic biosynthesis monooxygenase [Anaerolineaceae bacterium]